MTIQSCSSASIHKLLLAVLVLSPASLLAEPVTLQQAVELALKHATGISIAAEDQQHASASYRELRNSYIPQLNAGAGIGWSDGFPLSLEGSAPSLFNVNAQSALINPALKDFIRATQSDIVVSTLQTKDQRNQVIQDTVLSYAELAKWEQRLSHLRETMAAAEQTETAVAQRVKEGVDSEIDGSKARLSVARLRLRLAEASGAADVLREHLSKLTGLPTASVEIDPDSVPSLPTPSKVERGFLVQGRGREPSSAGRRRTCARPILARQGGTQVVMAERRFCRPVCIARRLQQLRGRSTRRPSPTTLPWACPSTSPSSTMPSTSV